MLSLKKILILATIPLFISACDLLNTEQQITQKKLNEIPVTTLCFGVYTSDNVRSIFKKFTPLRKYLQNTLRAEGSRVIIKNEIYHSYSDAIDALADGDCDFFRVGPASYILAKDKNPNIQLLAIEHKKNKKRFSGVIVSRRDSPINELSDLKGATFAFGNENSTIGRYLSQAELVNTGIHSYDLEDFDYLGRHDWVARSVSDGDFEAGALKKSTYKKFADQLKIIKEFPNVTKPWVARAGLDKHYTDLLRKALLDLTDKKILKALKKSGFLPTTDEDFDFVRKGMAQSAKF